VLPVQWSAMSSSGSTVSILRLWPSYLSLWAR
jgi:hypothetical protein